MAAVLISSERVEIDLKTVKSDELGKVIFHLTNLQGDIERAKQARMIFTPDGSFDPLEDSTEHIASFVPRLEAYIVSWEGALARTIADLPEGRNYVTADEQHHKDIIDNGKRSLEQVRLILAARQTKQTKGK